ncbi:UNVERIFIED_CONTAM: hypothetical protein K2H54_055020 [Gekko kuhli]
MLTGKGRWRSCEGGSFNKELRLVEERQTWREGITGELQKYEESGENRSPRNCPVLYMLIGTLARNVVLV